MSFAVASLRVLVLLAAALSATAQEANQRNGTVNGRVLGPLGQPMPNVEVVASRNPRGVEVVAKTRTDGEGMFVMARLPNDTGCNILASAPGHTTAMGYASLGPDQSDVGLELRLWEANTLRGRVLDAEGKPLAGAALLGAKDYASFAAGFLAPAGNTDAEGRFELNGVPIGDCVIRAWAPGFVTCEHPLFAVADANVEVRLTRGEGVSLAITTERLPPEVRRDTKVLLSARRNGYGFSLPQAIERNVLDGEGRLTLAGLLDVEWYVELSLPGFTFDPRSVTVKPGPRVHPVAFRTSRDGEVVLRGTLRSSEGKALGAQTLLCRTQRPQAFTSRPGETVTAADGRFEMRAPLMAAEPYTLHLVGSNWVLQQEKRRSVDDESDLRYRVRWEETADASRELALVAVPAAFVTARLVDAENRPIPFVWTELQGRRRDLQPPWGAVAYATSMKDGTLRFPAVLDLGIDLRVQAQGSGGAGDSEPFRIAAGEKQAIDVRMQRPGVIKGRVFDAGGKPLAGARVSLRNFDLATGTQPDGSWTNVCSDREGRFVFTGVAPGGHRIDEGRNEPAGRGSSEPFEVAPGATVTTELRLGK